MFRTGIYLEAPNFPARLGLEAAGVVDAVGPGVTGFALAMRAGMTAKELKQVLFPYPTHASDVQYESDGGLL